jgi:LPXTG-motif cell wall-anchored protein
MHLSIKTGGIKFVAGWFLVLALRFIPFRPANFEPMLAVLMPYAKRYTLVSGFLFGFLGIFAFDILTGKMGMWTLITGVAYGLLGAGGYFFFKRREGTIKNYLVFGIAGTLAYDAVTGLSIGPLFFGQPFMAALLGQIPFTLMHLLGTVTFSIVLSPVLYKWIVTNEVLEVPVLLDKAQTMVKRF